MASFTPSSTPHLMDVNGFVFVIVLFNTFLLETFVKWPALGQDIQELKLDNLGSENWIHHSLIICWAMHVIFYSGFVCKIGANLSFQILT